MLQISGKVLQTGEAPLTFPSARVCRYNKCILISDRLSLLKGLWELFCCTAATRAQTSGTSVRVEQEVSTSLSNATTSVQTLTAAWAKKKTKTTFESLNKYYGIIYLLLNASFHDSLKAIFVHPKWTRPEFDVTTRPTASVKNIRGLMIYNGRSLPSCGKTMAWH